MVTDIVHVQLSPIRWLVAIALACIGLTNGFTRLFFAASYRYLAMDYELDVKSYEWNIFGDIIVAILASFGFAVWTKIHPFNIKRWILTVTILLSIGLAGMIGALIQRSQVFVIFIAQVLCSMATAIFVTLVIFVSTSWFGEEEQGTIFSVGYSSLAVGNGLVVIVPTLLKSSLADVLQEKDDYRSVYILLCAISCILIFLVTVISWIFIPSLPKYPPTEVEAQRLQAIIYDHSVDVREAIRQSVNELGHLFSNRISFFLLLSSSVGLNVFYQQYLLISISQPGQDGSDDSLVICTIDRKHMAMLLPTLGGAIASAILGAVLDKTKCHTYLTCVLGVLSVILSLQMLVFFHVDFMVAFQVAICLFTFVILSVVSFSGQLLKQQSYPTVSESSQGIALTLLTGLVLIIFSLLFPSCVGKYGEKWLYILTSLFSAIICMLLVTISPDLKRTRYQSLSEEAMALVDGG